MASPIAAEVTGQRGVPFNRPFMTGKEVDYIVDAHMRGHLAGDGFYTKSCEDWIQQTANTTRSLLTHSCTAALEMAAILADIGPGDEVILPSYTFVSTANAFVLRGATPVFVDIRQDTLNLDEALIEEAVTSRTKAIVPVHYAGVACEMDTIMAIAAENGLLVIEDAAQAVMATYHDRMLGSIGDLGTYSFHETKNVISGEGGALLVNRDDLPRRAEVLREKGTNRSAFFRGQVDKYTWVDIGSSFLPGEIVAAFLFAQLEQADAITQSRLKLWNKYHEALEVAEKEELLRRPVVPDHCQHNAHMYYVLLPDGAVREGVIGRLSEAGIHAVFHYVPLHSSPAGRRMGRSQGELPVTDRTSECLLRLPLWVGMDDAQDHVLDHLTSILGNL